MAFSLKNLAQRIFDSTTLDERAIKAFRNAPNNFNPLAGRAIKQLPKAQIKIGQTFQNVQIPRLGNNTPLQPYRAPLNFILGQNQEAIQSIGRSMQRQGQGQFGSQGNKIEDFGNALAFLPMGGIGVRGGAKVARVAPKARRILSEAESAREFGITLRQGTPGELVQAGPRQLILNKPTNLNPKVKPLKFVVESERNGVKKLIRDFANDIKNSDVAKEYRKNPSGGYIRLGAEVKKPKLKVKGQGVSSKNIIPQDAQAGLSDAVKEAYRNFQPATPEDKKLINKMYAVISKEHYGGQLNTADVRTIDDFSRRVGIKNASFEVPQSVYKDTQKIQTQTKTLSSSPSKTPSKSIIPQGFREIISPYTGEKINVPDSPDAFMRLGLRYEDYVNSRVAQQPVADATRVLKGVKATEKPRGFTTSVQESPKVTKATKARVGETYTPKPNEQLMGEARALLNESASLEVKNVQNIDQKIAATIQEAINLDKAGKHKEAAALYNNLSTMGTELGRGTQAFSLLDRMSPQAISLSIAGKIKQYNQQAIKKIPELTGAQTKEISEIVGKINKMKPGRQRNLAVGKLEEKLNSFIPSSIQDKAVTVWKAGLLTSLRTHERNIIGNTIHGVAEFGKDVPASIADMVLSAKTGKRTLTFTGRGVGSGTKKGGQAAKDYLLHGFDPEDAISKYDVKKINWGNNPVEKTLKAYTEAVFRTLGGADKPFYHAAYARSMYDQAGAAAINAGKRGDAKFIETLVKNPTVEMKQNALLDAEVATFKNTNRLSEVARNIKRKGGVVGEVLAPFTGVPSAIAGQILAYSPIGLIRGSLKAGRVLAQDVPELQRVASQEIGRGVMGTGLFGLGAYLAGKGLMTGQPKDANEARQWQLEGKQANSVMIGGKWRSINSVGPENLVMLAGGKAQQELGTSNGEGVGALGAGLGKDFLSQTMLQGVQGPLNALNDPGRYAQNYIKSQVASVIPNLTKDMAKAGDPTARQTNSVQEALMAGIPGLRNQLLPRQDALGQNLPQEPTGAAAFVDLFNSKTPVTNSGVIDELARLNNAGFNAVPSKLQKDQTINGEKITLTPEQLNNLNAQSGSMIAGNLAELFATPEYQALSDQEKQEAIDDMVSKTRKIVRANIDINSSAISYDTQATTVGGTKGGRSYTLISDSGTVKKINLDEPIDQPKLTGNTELDKKLISKYKSAITSRKNDIVALYEAGKIDAKTAEEELAKLTALADSTGGKGKKLTKLSLPKESIKFPKLSFTSMGVPQNSGVKLKKPPTPNIRLTANTNKKFVPRAFRNDLARSTRLV